MPLPSLPRGRYQWVRLPSHGWVELPLQQLVVAWLVAFEAEHGWVERGSMRVEERFADNGVHVRVPYGPTGPPQRKDNYLQRPGTPLLNFSCKRERDRRCFEVSIAIPTGNDMPLADTTSLLACARESLRAVERSAR